MEWQMSGNAQQMGRRQSTRDNSIFTSLHFYVRLSRKSWIVKSRGAGLGKAFRDTL